MAKGVTYTKQSDAEKYASEVGGTVVPVDKDSDGVTDGFNVIEPQEPGKDEVITKPLRNMGGISYKHGDAHNTERSVELRMGPALTAKQLEQEKKVSSELDDEMAKFKARAKARAAKAKNKNMGGMMTDELGYMRGGMTEEARGPIKYSKGGAIAGKNFKGSF